MKKILLIALTVGLTANVAFSENPKPTRVQTESGSFTKKVVTVKRKYYIKATAMVYNRANPHTTPPAPVSTSLAGHWATVAEAQAAFNSTYNGGSLSVVGAISVDPLGPEETTSGPTTTYETEAGRSSPKTQQKISADAQGGWSFVEWIGEPPPKCEIAGNDSSSSSSSGNTTTTTQTVNYTWTANWKEIKQ